MKIRSCASIFKCVGASILAMMIAAATPISVSAEGTIADGFFKESNESEKEFTSSEIKHQSLGETQEKLKALEEFNKLISAKEFDWYAGEGRYNNPSSKFMIPTDEMKYEIVFLGEEEVPALYIDNNEIASHADGYQGLYVYSNGKLNRLLADDQLYFYPKAGIIAAQHFGGGWGEVSKNYWKYDAAKGEVFLIAQEYHLTPKANISDYETQEDIDQMVKQGAVGGEYMFVYDSPVTVGTDFDWSSRTNGKEYTTKADTIKAFEGFFDNYGEFENFKKDMELFSK